MVPSILPDGLTILITIICTIMSVRERVWNNTSRGFITPAYRFKVYYENVFRV